MSYILQTINSNYLNLREEGMDVSVNYTYDTPTWGTFNVGDVVTLLTEANQYYGTPGVGETYSILNTSGANPEHWHADARQDPKYFPLPRSITQPCHLIPGASGTSREETQVNLLSEYLKLSLACDGFIMRLVAWPDMVGPGDNHQR